MLTTVTHRVAALQMKLLHVLFRVMKIIEDQKATIEKGKGRTDSREKLKAMKNAVYSFIDMLITFEYVSTLTKDFLGTLEISKLIDAGQRKEIRKAKSISEKWTSVRNKLGGHLDIALFESTCVANSYVGVFISDDLESDSVLLNMLLVEQVVNSDPNMSEILGRKLDMRGNNPGEEMQYLVEKTNLDWETIQKVLIMMQEQLYRYGKEEKLSVTPANKRSGLVN